MCGSDTAGIKRSLVPLSRNSSDLCLKQAVHIGTCVCVCESLYASCAFSTSTCLSRHRRSGWHTALPTIAGPALCPAVRDKRSTINKKTR